MTTLKSLIEEHHIECEAIKAFQNPYCPQWTSADHWNIRLYIPGKPDKQLISWYSKGLGHKGKKPTCFEVLQSLILDSMNSQGTFEDYCDYYGHDHDSIKSYQEYCNALKTHKEMKSFLGVHLQEFLTCEYEENNAYSYQDWSQATHYRGQ